LLIHPFCELKSLNLHITGFILAGLSPSMGLARCVCKGWHRCNMIILSIHAAIIAGKFGAHVSFIVNLAWSETLRPRVKLQSREDFA
jgi:hypothetical protein